MFQIVSNIYNRNVITSFSLEEFVQSMKNPDPFKKSQVDLARKIYKESVMKKDDPLYKSIKGALPCITFLNTFKDVVKNENIVESTGFIYFDIDDVVSIDLREFPFVVAYWKSLSNNGYGILIKCSNLSEDLLSNVNEMSEVLGIPLDKQASSKDRLNVMGYDLDIQYNPNYINYDFNSIKKVQLGNIYNTSFNRLSTECTVHEENYNKLRFSNLSDIIREYDFKGQPYVVFEEKLQYAEVFIPKNIFEGNRNKSMFIICSQIRGLNTWISQEYLLKVCDTINKDKFKPQLNFRELSEIVRKVYENKTPVVMLNKDRRIIFNPEVNLTKQERKVISGREVAKMKSNASLTKIIGFIDKWNTEEEGKLNYSKLAVKSGFSISTIKSKGILLRDLIKKVNNACEIKK